MIARFLLPLAFFLIASAPAEQSATVTVYLVRDGQASPVTRQGTLGGDPQVDATTLLTALLAGPTAAEQANAYRSALPQDADLAAVTVQGDEVTVELSLSLDFLRNELDPEVSDVIVEQIVKTVHPLGLHHVHVRAEERGGVADGIFLPLSSHLPRPPAIAPFVPPNDDAAPDRLGLPPGQLPQHVGQPPSFGQGRPQGALSGKTVWLSAGHGWYWSEVLNRWTTQRGNNHGLVEDFSNAEAVNYYLARYLWNAGADVWQVRDPAMTTHEIIVDNDDGAPAYTETGSWLTSSSPGYEGGTYRWSSTYATTSARATWTPDLPEAGWYAVSAWYRHGANRPVEARYEIHHAGGTTTVSISQEIHGLTWRYLGEYYFEAGRAGHVTLVNGSGDPGQAVIADATRFGGGLGTIPEPRGTSGRPRWEEAAIYWARYQGMPMDLCSSDPVCRPLYAEWETARGYAADAGDAVYVSWHTNAGGGTGTESYIHNAEPTPGSADLQKWVHSELIHDLRAAWNPQWVNRGRKSADFSEVRELSTIPGVLLEIAFHDSEDPGDADDLREPVFRQLAARAVFQGIVKYFAGRDETQVHLSPEPPTRLVARNTGPGQVMLTWAPPACCDDLVGDAATAYKIYQSTDGRAFDNGLVTTGPSLTVTGLSPGDLRFFRVTALNQGGESFPTPVVGVRTPVQGASTSFLLVDGFDRLDQTAMIPQYEAPFLGTDQRMFLERMNRYGYAVEHAQSLAACGLAFDGAVNEAIEAGDVALDNYAAVDWFVGEESVADASLSDAERMRLAAYLDGGGRLLISGAEIGYDLVEQGRDPGFYRDYLRARYLGDDAGSHSFVGVAGGPWEQQAGTFDDGSGSTYAVGYPDRLAAAGGSVEVLRYASGAGGGAAVAYNGEFRVVHFGFPLETVTDATVRTSLFCSAASYLLAGDEPPAARCSSRLINPGFEGGKGQAAWQVFSSRGAPAFVYREDLPAYVEPHGDDWLARLGGDAPDLMATTVLTQAVSLPAGDPVARLSLAWFVPPEAEAPQGTGELSAGVYDMKGALLAELLTVSGQVGSGVWQTGEFDLSAFAGQTIQLVIRGSSRGYPLFVDDVALVTCGSWGNDEIRALWVDAYHDGIKSPQQIEELVETARAGNFNALVVQIRRRGDTYYPSSLDPWASDAVPGFDALAYLIEQAHAAGIEVHAWATTLAIWNGETPPVGPDHAFNRHGPGATGRDYWLMSSYAGLDGAPDGSYFLDPGHPDAVDYTVAIYAELAARYDLDGLHLDRVRYPGPNYGYNPTSVARFLAQTGRSGQPDPQDEQWLQWRRDQVTALVRKIHLTTAAINPRLRLSAALSVAGAPPTEALPWETRTPYTQHLQDWRSWLEEGVVDLAFPMVYRDQDTLGEQFEGWVSWAQDHAYGRGVVIGTGLYLNDVADSMDQWNLVRDLSAGGAERINVLDQEALGISGYSYATPSDDGTSRRAFVNAVVADVYTQSARIPTLPWKDAPALGHLMGSLIQTQPCINLEGISLKLTGPLPLGSSAAQVRYVPVDGNGWFGAVDLLPGDYLLILDGPGAPSTVGLAVSVSPGVVTVQDLLACPLGSIYLPLVLSNAQPR